MCCVRLRPTGRRGFVSLFRTRINEKSRGEVEEGDGGVKKKREERKERTIYEGVRTTKEEEKRMSTIRAVGVMGYG